MSHLIDFRKKKVDAADGCKQGYTTETFDGCTPSCKCKDGSPVKMWNQSSSGPNVGKGCCPATPAPSPSITHNPTYSCEIKYGPNKIYNQNYVLEKRWPDLGPYKSPEDAKDKCPQNTWNCAKYSHALKGSCTVHSDGSGVYGLNLGTKASTTQVFTSSADVKFFPAGVNDLKDSCENDCIQPPKPELGATILPGRCEANMTKGMSKTFTYVYDGKTLDLKDCITFCKKWNPQSVGELGSQIRPSCTCWKPKDLDTWVYAKKANKGGEFSCNTSFILDKNAI
jgi:hypothetical protein